MVKRFVYFYIIMTSNRQILAVFLGITVFSGSIPFSFSESEMMAQNTIQSPRKQIEQGVLPEEIQCRENRVLVLRTNGNVACVSEKTSERLGWEIQIPLSIHSISEETDLESTEETVEEFVTHIPDPQINEKPISKENNEIQLIIDPENVMDYIPKTSIIKHAFEISAWDRNELAQKITSITDDEITSQYQTPDNGTNYETIKGTIQIRGSPTGGDLVSYKLMGEHKIQNKVVKDFTLMFQQELGYPITYEVLKERLAPDSDKYWFVQVKDNIFVEYSGIGTYTDGMHTSIHIRDWYANLDEVELYDYEEAKQIGKDYAILFDELTDPSCNLIYNEEFGTYDWQTSLKIIHGTPIYSIYAGHCEVNQPMHKPSDWYANINALTGEPLYLANGGIM